MAEQARLQAQANKRRSWYARGIKNLSRNGVARTFASWLGALYIRAANITTNWTSDGMAGPTALWETNTPFIGFLAWADDHDEFQLASRAPASHAHFRSSGWQVGC